MLTDDNPVYHARSVHVSRANLITRASTIDMLWRNFLSPEFGAKFQRGVPLFLKVPEFHYKRRGAARAQSSACGRGGDAVSLT